MASLPSARFGEIDPVKEVSKLAGKYNIGMFVDANFGSMLLPFAEELEIDFGENKKFLDLRIPNMTAYCMTPHNFGIAPNNLGVLFFGKKEM